MMTIRLNLAAVEGCAAAGAQEAFDTGDAATFVSCAYSTGGMLHLVIDNWTALKARGMAEAALFHAYIGCKINHRGLRVSLIERLFRSCNRQRLLSLGTPLPEPFFIVYRGVSGLKGRRRIRGLSWTMSKDVACSYALRFCPDMPAVYVARVGCNDVFCITNERNEQEVICRPRSYEAVTLTASEMQQGFDRHAEQVRQRNAKAMENLRRKLGNVARSSK